MARVLRQYCGTYSGVVGRSSLAAVVPHTGVPRLQRTRLVRTTRAPSQDTRGVERVKFRCRNFPSHPSTDNSRCRAASEGLSPSLQLAIALRQYARRRLLLISQSPCKYSRSARTMFKWSKNTVSSNLFLCFLCATNSGCVFALDKKNILQRLKNLRLTPVLLKLTQVSKAGRQTSQNMDDTRNLLSGLNYLVNWFCNLSIYSSMLCHARFL